MVTHLELQTMSLKFPYPPHLPLGTSEMPRRIGQPCGQYTVGGHVTVISLQLDWVRKVEMEGCGQA